MLRGFVRQRLIYDQTVDDITRRMANEVFFLSYLKVKAEGSKPPAVQDTENAKKLPYWFDDGMICIAILVVTGQF